MMPTRSWTMLSARAFGARHSDPCISGRDLADPGSPPIELLVRGDTQAVAMTQVVDKGPLTLGVTAITGHMIFEGSPAVFAMNSPTQSQMMNPPASSVMLRKRRDSLSGMLQWPKVGAMGLARWAKR